MPSWGISKIFPSSGAAACNVETKSGKSRDNISMMMSVPLGCREHDPDPVEDHFFVFISTPPTDGQLPSWGDICLPSIRPAGDVKSMLWAPSPQDSGARDDW
ncbi:hypothetical protein V3481_016591 [Fusarium oxysporum f. sp. vasinfectum]